MDSLSWLFSVVMLSQLSMATIALLFLHLLGLLGRLTEKIVTDRKIFSVNPANLGRSTR
jgi:hypothetical protein